MTAGRRQIHLAAHFPGVNNTTVWSDPAAGSNIDFGSFVHLAQTAARAKFDFFFLAEGLRMREHADTLHELDVAGRPDSMTVVAALAAVTERLGLVPTITSTYHEPHELARQLGTIDVLSGGRAASTWWAPRTRSPAPTSDAAAISAMTRVTRAAASSSRRHGRCGIRGLRTRSPGRTRAGLNSAATR
jgi:hypothetical protein